MLKKILIANRGEIAVRIIRACREMEIHTVAVYSEADKESLHKTLADESVCIGAAPSIKSYLNIKAIIEAACLTGADSIHPGFGFLSENSHFAKICEEIGIKFIGPSSSMIELLGNKAKAKATMKEAGVPVVLGSKGIIKSKEEAKKIAKEIGYPVILKASAGGGGKDGIRINAISAGPIKTLSAKGIKDFSSILDIVEEKAPLHKNVTTKEVGDTVSFLFSNMASSITGEIIHVDNGFSTVGV